MLATPLHPSLWLSVPTGRLPLELRLKIFNKVFSFLGVPRTIIPVGQKEGDEVRNLNTCPAIFTLSGPPDEGFPVLTSTGRFCTR